MESTAFLKETPNTKHQIPKESALGFSTGDLELASPRGFTLVEMLVVLAIITLITVVAVTGQSDFNRSLILTDTAYTVAFSLREAQTLGLSSRVFNAVQDAGYGIRFARSTPTSYMLFSDQIPASPGSTQSGICPGHTFSTGPDARPGNCVYDNATELVRTYSFNQGFTVRSFCGTTAAGSQYCTTDSTPLDAIDIVYMRPSTDSVITGVRGSTLYQMTSAVIRVASPDGAAERCIQVSKVGQVAVVTCP